MQGYNDGVVLDLSPYMQKDAPDYYNMSIANHEIWRETTMADGRYMQMGILKLNPDPPLIRFQYRKDWVDQLGLDVPRTIDDYTNMFQAAKSAGLCTYPFLLPKTGIQHFLMAAFNVVNGWYVDNGTVKFGQAQPEFKDYVTCLNSWYNKGFIDPDFVSMQDIDQQNAFYRGEAIGIFGGTDTLFTIGKSHGLTVYPAPYPRQYLGQKIHGDNIDPFPFKGQKISVVSATCKNPDVAVKWLNYGFSQEGSMVYNYGPLGIGYNMVDGQPQFADAIMHNPKFGIEPANYIVRTYGMPFYQFGGVGVNANLQSVPGAPEMRQMWADDPDSDKAFAMPPIDLPSADAQTSSKIMANVNTYCDQMVLKFITGAEPLANFDQYIAQLKQMGVDQATALQQKAYDAYEAR